MAQSIGNLGLGSKIKDSNGNIFTLVAHNHYGANQVTLMDSSLNKSLSMHNYARFTYTYEDSNIHEYLSEDYLNGLQSELVNSMLNSNISHYDYLSETQYKKVNIITKAFIPIGDEVSNNVFNYLDSSEIINYFNTNIYSKEKAWVRSRGKFNNGIMPIDNSGINIEPKSTSYTPRGYVTWGNGSMSSWFYEDSAKVVPFFNLSYDTLVSDDVNDGCYSFVFNEPPVIQNISNIKGNYGTPTEVTYTATDSDDTTLTHYISFNNGSTYTKITPSKNGNTYTYSHVFNELNTYYCRIKVVDSANNEVVSNAFTVTVNSVAPTVGIVNVVDRNITFKVNCITSDISKVEILVNNNIVKTFESGLNSNLSYEVGRNILNIGKNPIQIKATSQEGLVGYANLEANKEKYQLPPTGTKVEINGNDYFVLKATENESYQTYTLTENLKTNVGVGDLIKVSQDNIKVLCSLSNLENIKDYKEMKLVKTKKLKGDFEGYIEEKYELQGEGRYSAIKLDIEKFSSSAQTEVLELQQYFDYMED